MAAELKKIENKPNQDAIEILEEALARIKSGETNGIFLVEQKPNEVTWSCAGLKDRFMVMGYLMYAIQKLEKS